MIKYYVQIGWHDECVFDNREAAVAFAEVYLTHRMRDVDEEKNEVTIRMVEERK